MRAINASYCAGIQPSATEIRPFPDRKALVVARALPQAHRRDHMKAHLLVDRPTHVAGLQHAGRSGLESTARHVNAAPYSRPRAPAMVATMCTPTTPADVNIAATPTGSSLTKPSHRRSGPSITRGESSEPGCAG